MTNKQLLWGIILVLCLSFSANSALAVGDISVVSDYLHAYNMENNVADINSTVNLSLSGTTSYNDTTVGENLTSINLNYAGAGAATCLTCEHGIQNGSAWTIAYWIAFDATGFHGGVGNYDGGRAGSMAYFGHGAATTFNFYGFSSGDLTFSGTPQVNNDQMVHLAWVSHGNKSLSLYINGSLVEMKTASVNLYPEAHGIRIGQNHVNGAGVDGRYDGWRIYNRALSATEVGYIFDGSEPAPPVSNDNYITQEAFSTDFTNTVTVETTFTEVASLQFNITKDTTLSYYGVGLTTLGTQGTTTATCRLLVNSVEYTRQDRTINNAAYGNFFLMTPSVNISLGENNLTVECLRTVGGKYDIRGSTITGHLLYDAETNKSIGNTNSLANVTVTPTHTNVYNITHTTSNNYVTSSTNNLFLFLDWRASPTYVTTGNVSIQWKIHDTWCSPSKRTGTAGTIGSITNSCVEKNFLPNTTYTLQLWANGTANLTDLDVHIVELVQHNNSVANTTLDDVTLNTTIPRSLTTTIVNSVVGGNFDIYTKAIVHGQNLGTTSTTSMYYLKETTQTRETNRTMPADGSICNCGLDGLWSASGTDNKTVTLFGGVTNNNSKILVGEIVTYIVAQASVTPNTFKVYAYNYYDNTSLATFNVSIGASTFIGSNGFATVTTSNPIPDVVVNTSGYFTNTTLSHDRTTTLNASLVRWTHLRPFYQGTLVQNYTVSYNNTVTGVSGNFSTQDGSTYLPLEKGQSYNITLENLNNNGLRFANLIVGQSIGASYLQYLNVTVQLRNTFNLSFIDEITEAPVNESVTLELITADSATNITINASDTGQYNISLLSPAEYTLRYRSTSYTERDYIITLNNNTFENLDLYMITIAASSDVSANVENTAGEPVENATISLMRYFASCNCYKTVEMDRTSPAGQSVFWVQAFDGHYKWSINYRGTNKFLSTSPENIITDTRYFTIDTGQAYYQSYTALTGMGKAITYNQSSGVLTFTWSDPSNIVTQGCLVARYVDGTDWSELNNCASGASGSVILTLDNTTRYQYYGRVDTNTDFSSHTLVSGWIDNFNNFFDQYSTLGAFLGASVMMGLTLLFSFSAIAVLVINAVGMLVLGLLGITKISTTFLLGFITLTVGMSAFLMRR